jgi:simple sugar transport system permease protein
MKLSILSKDRLAEKGEPFPHRRLLLLLLLTVTSVVLALLLIAIPLLIVDINPIFVYRSILEGAFGNRYAFGQTLQRSVPLIFTSLAFAFAWQAGLFNIGAEGQLQLGALAATWVGLSLSSLPSILHAPLALLSGIIAGGLWAAIPGAMRALMGINEVISTIMLNFIALQITVLAFLGPLADETAPYATTPNIASSAELPYLVSGTRLHVGFLLALIVAIATHFFFVRTTKGLEIRAVGYNQSAARHVGIAVRSNLILGMAISGALAGLGGAVEVQGVVHRIGEGWSSAWGFEGIAVALLAQTHPLAIPFASAFFGALEAGANRMQAITGVPGSLIFLVQGLPVLFLVITSSRRFLRLTIGEA